MGGHMHMCNTLAFLQLVRTQVLNDENISVVPYDPISGNMILFYASGFGCKVQKFWELRCPETSLSFVIILLP